LTVLVLVLATVAAGGYFLVGRSSGRTASTSNDFVHTDQRIATSARALPTAAQHVQRFLELHQFDTTATAAIAQMNTDRDTLQTIAASQSGNAKQTADQAVTAANQAIDAADRFRRAVAFTYRLADADTARQDLLAAVATLDQQAKAWQHQ
jgi:hypothetical protein